MRQATFIVSLPTSQDDVQRLADLQQRSVVNDALLPRVAVEPRPESDLVLPQDRRCEQSHLLRKARNQYLVIAPTLSLDEHLTWYANCFPTQLSGRGRSGPASQWTEQKGSHWKGPKRLWSGLSGAALIHACRRFSQREKGALVERLAVLRLEPAVREELERAFKVGWVALYNMTGHTNLRMLDRLLVLLKERRRRGLTCEPPGMNWPATKIPPSGA